MATHDAAMAPRCSSRETMPIAAADRPRHSGRCKKHFKDGKDLDFLEIDLFSGKASPKPPPHRPPPPACDTVHASCSNKPPPPKKTT